MYKFRSKLWELTSRDVCMTLEIYTHRRLEGDQPILGITCQDAPEKTRSVRQLAWCSARRHAPFEWIETRTAGAAWNTFGDCVFCVGCLAWLWWPVFLAIVFFADRVFGFLGFPGSVLVSQWLIWWEVWRVCVCVCVCALTNAFEHVSNSCFFGLLCLI